MTRTIFDHRYRWFFYAGAVLYDCTHGLGYAAPLTYIFALICASTRGEHTYLTFFTWVCALTSGTAALLKYRIGWLATANPEVIYENSLISFAMLFAVRAALDVTIKLHGELMATKFPADKE